MLLFDKKLDKKMSLIEPKLKSLEPSLSFLLNKTHRNTDYKASFALEDTSLWVSPRVSTKVKKQKNNFISLNKRNLKGSSRVVSLQKNMIVKQNSSSFTPTQIFQMRK